MKNNVRYNSNTNNTSVIIFLIGSQLTKNSQQWYFPWENLQGSFCCCLFIFILHFVVVLHSFLSFILLLLFFISFPGCFAMSPALHPGFSGPRRPPPALSSTPTTFDCLCFFILCKRCGFEWAFFATGVFYFMLLHQQF